MYRIRIAIHLQLQDAIGAVDAAMATAASAGHARPSSTHLGAEAQLPPPRPTKEWSTWSSAKSHEMAAAVSAANEAHMARENSALVRLIEKLLIASRASSRSTLG